MLRIFNQNNSNINLCKAKIIYRRRRSISLCIVSKFKFKSFAVMESKLSVNKCTVSECIQLATTAGYTEL